MTLTAIETLLSQKIGIDASIIGSRKISKAVENRLSTCKLSNLETYLKVLQTSPQEFEELVEQIVVPETWFFRDLKSFDFLINFVRSEWLPKFGNTELRLLSVPCSSGEEPYSIAIALIEAGLPTNRFTIDAIDISKHAIAKAQRAIYGKNSFRGEENRMQGDAFSDNVNLTARLEGLTKFYGVSLLISEQALHHLSTPEKYHIRFLDRAIVKGRTEAIAVYEVLDAEIEEVRILKLQTQSEFERGLDYYKNSDLELAKTYFEKVIAVNPSDKTAKLYLERVEILLERGVPKNWNGVWTFTDK